MKTKGIGTSAIVAIIVAIVVAGIGSYLVLKGEGGPAVKLALESSELGSSWEGDKLESWYEGKGITQNFFKTVDVDENKSVRMGVYQKIFAYSNLWAALHDEDFWGVRESFNAKQQTIEQLESENRPESIEELKERPPKSIDLPFWDEAYASPCAGGDVGIVLRRDNIVVILQYTEFDILKNPETGEVFRDWVGKEISEYIIQEQEIENFLCDLAEIIQGKIIKTGGG